MLRPPATARGRAAAVILLILIVISLLVFEYQIRHLEADAAAWLYGFITPTLAASTAPIIWFGLGKPGAFGLIITPDCSSALLIAPLCIVGIGLLLPRRLAVRRVAVGLAGAAGLLIWGNLLRIGVIAWAIRADGIRQGYQLGHLVIGSLISVVCIAASLVLLTVTATSRDGQRPIRALLRRIVLARKRGVTL